MSRSSAVSSKESKKNKEKAKQVKANEVNGEDNFENGFKPIQSLFLSEIKLGIDE